MNESPSIATAAVGTALTLGVIVTAISVAFHMLGGILTP